MSHFEIENILDHLWNDSGDEGDDFSLGSDEEYDETLLDSGNTVCDYDQESSDEENHPTGDPQRSERSSGGQNQEDFVFLRANNENPSEIPFTADNQIHVDTTEFTPYDFFHLFVDDDILSHIVIETNRFAEQFIQGNEIRRRSRVNHWTPTNKEEMKQFIGLTFLMGIIRKPTVESYWSMDPLYTTPVFKAIMPRDRYIILMKFFHLNDSEKMPDANDGDVDKLFKNGQNTAFRCSLPNVVSSLDDPEECTSISSGFSAMSIVTTFCLWLCNCLVAIQEGYFSSAREESAQIQTLSQISTIKSEKQSLQNSGSKVLLKWIRDLSYVSSRETPWWIFGIHSVDNLSLGLFLHGATGKMAIKREDVNPPQPSTREISSVRSTSRTHRLIDDANFPGGSDCTQSNFCRQVVEKTTMKTNEVMLLETKQVNIQCLWTTLQNIKQAHLDVKDAYFVLERSSVVYIKKNSVLVIGCSRISTHGGDCTVSQLFCLAIRKATFNGGKEIKVVILKSYTSHSTMKTRFMIKESCVEKMSVGGQLESMRYCHALIIPNLNDVTSVGPDIAKANEVNDGGAKGYIRNVGGFQRIDRLNICDVSKTITVNNGGVGRSGWVKDDEVGRIKQAKIDSVCGTDEEHDGYFGRTAETIDDVGGTVRVHDDVGRTAEVCDGSVRRTGEVYNDVGRFAKVYDGDIERTVNLHDGNVGRTVEVLDGNVGRTALVHNGNVGRTVEVHDGNVGRTAEVHDSVASNGGGGDAGTKGGGSSDCCPGVAIGSRNGSAAGSPSIGSACCRRRGGGGNGDEDDPDKPDRKKLPDGTPCSRNVKSGKSKTEERKAEVSPGNRAASSADTVDTVSSGYREESGSGDGRRIQANMTQDELAIVEQVQHHPNIVKFPITEKKLNGRWKKVVEEEQRDKSLLAYRDKLVDGILDILEGMFYWRQIVDVFVYLHKHDLVYKDLKLANVYLANPHLIRAELAIFNSQEFLIVKEKGCMKEQNIRSLGRLLLELVIPGANSQSEQHSIEMLKKDSPSLGFLIQSCLQEDPRKRPTAEQLSQNAAVQVFDNPEPTVFLWSPTQSEL